MDLGNLGLQCWNRSVRLLGLGIAPFRESPLALLIEATGSGPLINLLRPGLRSRRREDDGHDHRTRYTSQVHRYRPPEAGILLYRLPPPPGGACPATSESLTRQLPVAP